MLLLQGVGRSENPGIGATQGPKPWTPTRSLISSGEIMWCSAQPNRDEKILALPTWYLASFNSDRSGSLKHPLWSLWQAEKPKNSDLTRPMRPLMCRQASLIDVRLPAGIFHCIPDAKRIQCAKLKGHAWRLHGCQTYRRCSSPAQTLVISIRLMLSSIQSIAVYQYSFR